MGRLEATDVKYLAIEDGQFKNCRGENSTGLFRELKWEPTYGGNNTFESPSDQYHYVDHVYVSGSTTH